MPTDYQSIARRTIGRWAGDRVVLVGDYAENSDLPARFKAKELYGLCDGEAEDALTNITDDVCRVIEHELNGKFTGTGWKDFVQKGV